MIVNFLIYVIVEISQYIASRHHLNIATVHFYVMIYQYNVLIDIDTNHHRRICHRKYSMYMYKQQMVSLVKSRNSLHINCIF